MTPYPLYFHRDSSHTREHTICTVAVCRHVQALSAAIPPTSRDYAIDTSTASQNHCPTIMLDDRPKILNPLLNAVGYPMASLNRTMQDDPHPPGAQHYCLHGEKRSDSSFCPTPVMHLVSYALLVLRRLVVTDSFSLYQQLSSVECKILACIRICILSSFAFTVPCRDLCIHRAKPSQFKYTTPIRSHGTYSCAQHS